MSQQPHHLADRFSFSTALFGMMVLALGMGIGRFLYTPMLPVLLAEGRFSFSELSWIASVNYAGYLVGSLLFSFGLFHLPGRLCPLLFTSAVATGILILTMAALTHPVGVMLARFLAGVASAGMLIFGSTLILQHTRHPFVVASLFSGVGVGIALGNEYVIAGLQLALTSQTLWTGAAAFSGLLVVLLALLLPSRAHAIPPAPLAKAKHQPMRWWLLAILYGLAGFGYIIVATYLPLMAKDAGSPLLTVHLWTLVGLSIVPGCFGWLWAAKRWGGSAMPDGKPGDSGCLCAPHPRQRLADAAGAQQYWFWRDLYGHHFAGDDPRPSVERARESQSVGLCHADLRYWADPRPAINHLFRQQNRGHYPRNALRRAGANDCRINQCRPALSTKALITLPRKIITGVIKSGPGLFSKRDEAIPEVPKE